MANLFKSGTEVFFIIVIILSIIISLSIPNKPLNYLVILISGFAAGKIIYSRRHKRDSPKQDLPYFIIEEFPYLIIIFAFFVGYMIGSYTVSRKVIFFMFMGSLLVSYYFHHKKVFIYSR